MVVVILRTGSGLVPLLEQEPTRTAVAEVPEAPMQAGSSRSSALLMVLPGTVADLLLCWAPMLAQIGWRRGMGRDATTGLAAG